MDAEGLLPRNVRERAVRSGREWAWRPEDVDDALTAAASASLACLGGQPQFVLPGGTCELYWYNCDSADQRPGEAWAEYVSRSKTEVRAAFIALRETHDFVSEGIDTFAFLREQQAKEVALADHLVFVLYFVCRPTGKDR